MKKLNAQEFHEFVEKWTVSIAYFLDQASEDHNQRVSLLLSVFVNTVLLELDEAEFITTLESIIQGLKNGVEERVIQ